MTKPITDNGRKRRRITRADMCNDLLAQILSLLPPKHAFRFQLVSKSWRSVILVSVLPRWLPNTMVGFFYQTLEDRCLWSTLFHGTRHAIAPKLSFLGLSSHQKIVDSCNGLILCEQLCANKRYAYLVCNPATNRMEKMPFSTGYTHAYLAFDPRLSPHYKVVAWNGRFMIYSSQTRQWTDSRMFKRGYENLHFKSRGQSTFRGGALYVAIRERILRFGLDNMSCKEISLPDSAKAPGAGAAFCRLGGKVCYTEIRDFKFSIWELEQHNDVDEWSMKQSIVMDGIKEVWGSHCKPRILICHPYSMIVFFLVNHRVLEYDLITNSFKEICSIKTTRYEVITATAIPFTPCLLDALGTMES